MSVSTTRFDNPEVSEKPLKVNLAMGHGSRSHVSIEETNPKSPLFLTFDDEEGGTEIYLFTKADVTAYKGLAISLTKDQESDFHVGVKYQFYGEHSEQSIRGNLSQAFTIGYESNETNESFNASTFWQHDTNIYDVAWVIGYKVLDNSIIYGGPFYQWGDLDGDKKILLTNSTNLKELNSTGNMIGANIAFEHRFSFGLGLAGEYVISKLNWDGFKETGMALNFKLDYQF